MGNLAWRIEGETVRAVSPEQALGWLPPESPLEMPRQSLGKDAPTAPARLATTPDNIAARRRWLALATLTMTVLVSIAPFILYARRGFEPLEVLAFAVFLCLVIPLSCWFSSAVAGFRVMITGREQDDLAFAPHPETPTTRTALLMPLCNEDAAAACGRLAAIDISLARLGASEAFDVIILSDSNAASAPAEEAAFQSLRAMAHGRVFYRRRTVNEERKAGNIAEWVQRFGGAYDFMIVLDADSTLAGETTLRLVDAMERNPGVGQIQTTPTIVGAQTLFARVSQFSVKMYGRVAAAGLAWWSGSESSYWGHNAIVRTKAFAACARLPILPGQKPFGGDILSHDVVEAALLRRAGWAVHVTAALDGSCEETPPTILEFIRREQRWCQGNLQHLGLIRAPGLHPISRLQLAMGAVAYLASPLWLSALTIGMLLQLRHKADWISFWDFLHPSFSPFMLGTLISGVLLIGPKLMGGWLVLSRRGERRAFGGGKAVLRSMAAEFALSALLAPILMLANTQAVIQNLRGRDVGWRPQQRAADGIARAEARTVMQPQLLLGWACAGCLLVRPDLGVCFAPIVLPLLFSAQIARWTSRLGAGEAFARRGLLAVRDTEGSALPVVGHAKPLPADPAPVLRAAEA